MYYQAVWLKHSTFLLPFFFIQMSSDNGVCVFVFVCVLGVANHNISLLTTFLEVSGAPPHSVVWIKLKRRYFGGCLTLRGIQPAGTWWTPLMEVGSSRVGSSPPPCCVTMLWAKWPGRRETQYFRKNWNARFGVEQENATETLYLSKWESFHWQ